MVPPLPLTSLQFPSFVGRMLEWNREPCTHEQAQTLSHVPAFASHFHCSGLSLGTLASSHRFPFKSELDSYPCHQTGLALSTPAALRLETPHPHRGSKDSRIHQSNHLKLNKTNKLEGWDAIHMYHVHSLSGTLDSIPSA